MYALFDTFSCNFIYLRANINNINENYEHIEKYKEQTKLPKIHLSLSAISHQQRLADGLRKVRKN